MTIKSDKWIRRMAQEHGMISPFEPGQVRRVTAQLTHVPPKTRDVISHGVSSYGYDLRIADEFKVFSNVNCVEINPKKIDERAFHTVRSDELERDEEGGRFIRIPPNSFALGYSVERFSIPENVLCVVLGKSTYARCGIVCHVTPLEPGWEGHVTIEVSNTTPLPARVYANEGLCQVLFFESDERCETSYRDKAGKYQSQPAKVVLPRV